MRRKALALQMLRDARGRGARGVTTKEFLDEGCGSRFGGRLQELRDEGYSIASERLSMTSWLYTLTHDAERDAGAPEKENCLIAAASPPPPSGSSAGVSLGVAAPPPAPAGAECPATPDDHAPARSSGTATPGTPLLTPLFDTTDELAPTQRASFYDHDPED